MIAALPCNQVYLSLQHEYMSYMAKKTQKRQSAIVSLSDRNAFEIQQTNNHKAQMLKDYEDTKSGRASVNRDF